MNSMNTTNYHRLSLMSDQNSQLMVLSIELQTLKGYCGGEIPICKGE